jgi:Zn-dependent metalloprotease
MKQLPFNTITVLWGIVILLASCAFTAKTQKVQSEQSNSTLQPPSKAFIEELKDKNACSGSKENDFCTHYYDFSNVDYQNYEPITKENIFEDYKGLLDFGMYDKVLFIRNKGSLKVYRQVHKGHPVLTQYTRCEIEIDTTNGKITRVRGFVLSDLDIDTSKNITINEARNLAIKTVPLKNKHERYSFEAWKDKFDPNTHDPMWKSASELPIGYPVIFEGKVGLLFYVIKLTTTMEAHTVVVDAKTGKILMNKAPEFQHFAPNTDVISSIPLKKKSVLTNSSVVESKVEYSIESPNLSGVNNEFLEFDIDVASLLNSEGFYKGEIFINYNSLTFGTNLATSGRITLTKGTVITAPNYTLSIVDVNPDRMKIVAESTPTSPNNYYTISNLSEELAHIKIDISNLAGSTGIEFEEIQMQGLSEFFDTNLSTNTPFDAVLATDELNIDISSVIFGSDSCKYCFGSVLDSVPCNSITNCTCSSFTPITTFVPTYYYNCKSINLDSCSTGGLINARSNLAKEHTQGWDISTFVSSNAYPKNVEWCINDTIFLNDTQRVEANGIYAIQVANKYYADPVKFGINSYDDAGSTINLFFHSTDTFGNSTNDALWGVDYPVSSSMPPITGMHFGDGKVGDCQPMVSLGIVAHEYTHAVLNEYFNIKSALSTNLALSYSTKAIHESLADIFSTIIKRYEFGITDWTVSNTACNTNTALVRRVDRPDSSFLKQAIYYQDTIHHWSLDSSKIYNRAGVISYWFYLLSEGGDGAKGDNVTGLGFNTSENILRQTLKNARLDGGVLQYSFEGFRDLSLQAVIGLYGECSSQHHEVVKAWIAVGLLDCDNLDVVFVDTPTPDPCVKTLTAKIENGSGCYTYEWFKIVGGVDSALSINNHTINVLCNNVYKVKVTDTYLGCDKTENHSVFATNTRNIEQLNLDVTVRPTLTNNQIYFDLEINQPTTVTISIFDQLGRLITQPIISEKVYQGSRTIQYNVENLSSGLYFVSIETPEGKIVKKFVKM